MKTLYSLLLLFFCFFIGKAQIITIPDANFKAKLLASTASNYIALDASGWSVKIDANNDSQIQLSEALLVSSLNVSNSDISSLVGIENFTNLKSLYCSGNSLSGAFTLSTLVNLKDLFCNSNQITSLNLSNMPELKNLGCSFNNLTSLTLTGFSNLLEINCNSNNNLTALTLSNLPLLTNLYSDYCNLSSVALNSLTNLHSLSINYNHLTSLNLNGLLNLTNLSCAGNQLTALDVNTLTALTGINCGGNQIAALNVSNLINLVTLVFSYNQVQSIDVSNLHNLSTLICVENNISTYYLKNGYNYTLSTSSTASQMYTYTLDDTPVSYICADENKIASLSAYFPSPTTVINSYCSFTPGGTYYIAQGNTRYDSNNNGCDNADINYPNLKLSLTNGVISGTSFSDNTGNYSIAVSAGTHTITPVLENPAYFNISPTSTSVAFPTQASPFTQNFCVTANGTHNDLETAVFPLTPARPGFDATYKIIYKNKGNTIQNGTVSLDYYDPIEDFVSAVPNFTSQATNTLYWSFSNLLPFETREILVTFNLNSPLETPPVSAGNGISHTATITGVTDETPNDNESFLDQTVVNSFDPNDKTCTEGNFLPTYKVGNYLHYVIRFENTGTANAENIVVTDLIDTTKFNINTLVPLSGSHAFETKISATNKVEFIFQNINLPFDDAHNDGYVAFKIKSLPTLTEGTLINNTANIYFDYNAPIVTNTYTVNVYNPLSTTDFDFGTLFTLSPVPAKNSLTITNKQAVTINSISIYNTLGQLVQVITHPNDTIDVSNLYTGNYFIKIISDKGTATAKFIKE